MIRTLKEDKKWLVYPLSASGEAVSTLISKLSMEKFIDTRETTTSINSITSVGGNAVIVSGSESISVQKTFADNKQIYSTEAMLTKMIATANEKTIRF